jgi:formate dehydrogenase maturation protein FdhE
MGVRLARSSLREEWSTVKAQCEGCGQVSELKVLDREHAFCSLCGTTNTWMVLELDGDGHVAVTGRREGSGG